MPSPMPDTIPDDEPTEATEGELLVHVPPAGLPVSVDVPPAQIVVTPPIGLTGFTFIVLVAVVVLPQASVEVTVYVVVVAGLTVSLAPTVPPGVQT